MQQYRSNKIKSYNPIYVLKVENIALAKERVFRGLFAGFAGENYVREEHSVLGGVEHLLER